MPILNGPFYPGAQTLATTSVTADRNAWLGTATGRTVLGYSVRAVTGTPCNGALYRMATVNSANLTTALFSYFELGTAGIYRENFGVAGIDCSAGVSIDWTTGSFDISLYYIDVT